MNRRDLSILLGLLGVVLVAIPGCLILAALLGLRDLYDRLRKGATS